MLLHRMRIAGHYLAVVEAHRRVQLALEALRRVQLNEINRGTALAALAPNPNKPPDYDPLLWFWEGGEVWLLSAATITEYSADELSEMAKNLEACIERHHKAMVDGYGDEALREKSGYDSRKRLKQMWSGPSERKTNGLISRMGGNNVTAELQEQGRRRRSPPTRRLLRTKSKWTVLDVEPRTYTRPKKARKP